MTERLTALPGATVPFSGSMLKGMKGVPLMSPESTDIGRTSSEFARSGQAVAGRGVSMPARVERSSIQLRRDRVKSSITTIQLYSSGTVPVFCR